MSKPACVLFDLDGTLLDTARDFARALNKTLRDHQRPELADNVIREKVSQGGVTLVCLGFDITPEDPAMRPLWQEFIDNYAADVASVTVYFAGMAEVIAAIEAQGIKWGIVTNKPGALTIPLLAELGISPTRDCVVSGDTLDSKKPSAKPLLFAAAQLNVAPEDCLYVGDDQRDMQASNRAGMTSIAAAWGYIDQDDDINTWQADHIIQSPEELHGWLA